MVPGYVLRMAEEGDLPAIKSIFCSAREFMAAHKNPQWSDGYPYADVLDAFVRGGNMRVMECGGVAAAVYSVFPSDPDYGDIDGEWLTGGPYLAAHTLAVSPDFRGRGLAGAALGEIFGEAERSGKTSVRMDTHIKNAPMRDLLLSAGFVLCGTLKSRGGGDFICFERLL